MLDLGTPIFEVALGLAFIFFLFSLVISSAVEGIASIFQVRETNLERGVERMLGDPSLAKEVLDNSLVKVDVTSEKRKPAYVSSRNFGLALTQILRKKGRGSARSAGNGKKAMKELVRGVGGYPDGTPVREQLDGMLEEAQGSVAGFRTAAERWFDDGMDRVSGWYRSWSQVWTCVLALVIAVALNVDTIRIAERLGDNTALRATVVKQAEKTAAEEEEKPKEVGENTEDALGQIKALNLPILWGEDNDNVTVNTAIGWLITFLALSLGAPFWFDALSKLAHLKTTGKKPEPAK
jgi:hypothetical protein